MLKAFMEVFGRGVPAVRARHWHVTGYSAPLVLVRSNPFLQCFSDPLTLTSISNFVIALTVPALIGAWTPQGMFGWFAAWK